MKALSLGTFVIAAIALSALLDSDSGLSIWLDLRRDLGISNGRVEQLMRENDALRSEIAILESEPAAVDRAIREELDLVLPGEVVVRFEAPAGGRGATGGPAGEQAPETGDSSSAWGESEAHAAGVGIAGESFGEPLPSVGAGWAEASPGAAGEARGENGSAVGDRLEGGATSELEAWADDAPTVVDDAEAGGESF